MRRSNYEDIYRLETKEPIAIRMDRWFINLELIAWYIVAEPAQMVPTFASLPVVQPNICKL